MTNYIVIHLSIAKMLVLYVQALSASLLTMLVASLMLGVAVEAQFRQVITMAALLQCIGAAHQLCYN